MQADSPAGLQCASAVLRSELEAGIRLEDGDDVLWISTDLSSSDKHNCCASAQLFIDDFDWSV